MNLKRHDLLREAALPGFGVATLSLSEAAEAIETVSTEFVGMGARDTEPLRILVRLEGVNVVAGCEIDEANLRDAPDLVEKVCQPRPQGHSRGENNWRRFGDRNDLDLIVNAAPWRWHTHSYASAIKAGKHAATEISTARGVEQGLEFVKTAEQTGKSAPSWKCPATAVPCS